MANGRRQVVRRRLEIRHGALSQLLKSWRTMRRSLTREKDTLEERARLISTLFAYRDGSIPLRKWLIALSDAVLNDACEQEPDWLTKRTI